MKHFFNDENFPIYVQKFWALASRGKWKTNPGLLDWATSGLPGRNNDHRYLVISSPPQKKILNETLARSGELHTGT